MCIEDLVTTWQSLICIQRVVSFNFKEVTRYYTYAVFFLRTHQMRFSMDCVL